jgi:hypothetical protein
LRVRRRIGNIAWDGGTPSLQTGRSIRDQMIAAGRRVRVMPQLKVEQGIQAARTISGKCYQAHQMGMAQVQQPQEGD